MAILEIHNLYSNVIGIKMLRTKLKIHNNIFLCMETNLFVDHDAFCSFLINPRWKQIFL